MNSTQIFQVVPVEDSKKKKKKSKILPFLHLHDLGIDSGLFNCCVSLIPFKPEKIPSFLIPNDF